MNEKEDKVILGVVNDILLDANGKIGKNDFENFINYIIDEHIKTEKYIKKINSIVLEYDDDETLKTDNLISSFKSKLNNQVIKVPDKFRILPKKSENRNTEAKLKFPTYYLGLSRLYPVGESENVSISSDELDESDLNYFRDNYHKIFDPFDEIKNLNSMSILGITKKKGIGLETDKYGPLGNSNGQDNLNQIIASILSFKKLKEKQGGEFKGGLLLIDELDASLHPTAQNKLLDFILVEARNIGIQVVFTTHSLSLIKHFINVSNRQGDGSNDIRLSYITNGRGTIEVNDNPSFTWIENELLVSIQARHAPKIKVISEDENARRFIKKALSIFGVNLQLEWLDLSTGWQNIINLIKSDSNYFGNFITILDADISKDKLNSILKGTPYSFGREIVSKNSILLLPSILPDFENLPKNFVEGLDINEGDYRPYIELELWSYLIKLDDNDKFYNDDRVNKFPFYKRNLISDGPNTKQRGNVEAKIKSWFKDYNYIMDIAMEYFIDDNEQIIKKFINQIIDKYNISIKDDPQLNDVPNI